MGHSFILFFVAAIGISFGFLLVGSFFYFKRMRTLRLAELEAENIVTEAGNEAELMIAEAQLEFEEFKEALEEKYSEEFAHLEAKNTKAEQAYREKRSQVDRDYQSEMKNVHSQEERLAQLERSRAQKEKNLQSLKSQYRELQKKYSETLAQRLEWSLAEKQAQAVDSFVTEFEVGQRKIHTEKEHELRIESEEIAKRLINNALGRFAREACMERGIGIIPFESEDVKTRLLSRDREALMVLERECGVEIQINENSTIFVMGFDPVRRQLSCMVVEKLIRERDPTAAIAEKLLARMKQELFKSIEDDGRKIAQELRAGDLHGEIKKMLGSLRYRYSFSQNQYFHVGEVGWMCGLLASELGGVSVADARRSGLLHDVGKAMDHVIEGGHAVIGADFIKTNGERDEIVHAVRAHHFEEQPASDLAYLVIAADAISGARPGARRATVNTYNEKIEALSTIADDFPGVLRTFVYNAGREVRVVVDGVRVSDKQSLVLARQIADKIENECTYPGQIRVVVLRETHAETMAR